MITYQEIQQYIIESLGKLRAETIWQKSNKNKPKDDAQIDSDLTSNSIQSKNNNNKPQIFNKDN